LVENVRIGAKIYQDLNGFEGRMDKKIDFQWIRGLPFHSHFALTVTGMPIKKGRPKAAF